MGENEYRTLGGVYVIVGILLFSFFLSNENAHFFLFLLFKGLMFSLGEIMMFGLPVLVLMVGSLGLALFGFVLVVRGGVRVARFSGFLCGISLKCYFYILFLNYVFLRTIFGPIILG